MVRHHQSSTNEINNPALLPESTRDYYRSTWGFDPVADCRILGSGRFQYEECFPLTEDLPLQAIGITICAHVDWEGEDVRNRIVFRRSEAEGQQKEAGVECTHTIIYAGPTSDALTFVENLDTSPDNPPPIAEEILNRTERPATLPPWEHFAALKSYVAAVADIGVIPLLRQSNAIHANPADDLPFGFNAEMRAQVLRALYTIAPLAMITIYRDLTVEFLDSHPPAAALDLWYSTSLGFAPSEDAPPRPEFKPTTEYPDWDLILRNLGTPTLIYWFRHTEIADKFQDRLFTETPFLAKAQTIAPDLPWETLRNEWKARREAEDLGYITSDHRGRGVTYFPPAEVWARTPFCDYTYPRILLSPDSTSSRRSRVQACLREMTQIYGTGEEFTDEDEADELMDVHFGWITEVSSHLDAAITTPFPADRVRPLPLSHYDHTMKYNEILTPARVADAMEHGNHKQRRAIVLTHPIPPELQVKLAAHWDFATRLALIGNPGTNPAVIATLAQDPQLCVRLAAAARVRRGAASFEPLFGEMLDPGELVWLVSSHPGVVFRFGVTTWGDGSKSYHDWFITRLHENKEQNKEREHASFEIGERHEFGELYGWAYSEGFFLEEDERGYHGSHLAYFGLGDYACGQFPCLYLGLNFLNDATLGRFDL